MQAAAKGGRLTRSLAAPFLAANGWVSLFIAAIVAGALVSAYWMSTSARVAPIIPIASTAIAQDAARSPEAAPSPARFASLGANRTPSEPAAGLAPLPPQQPPAPASACPAYFRWIHEDLRPWRGTGITRDTLDGAHRYGPKFRVTVVAGRLYVARYGRCFQTRDVFTQWGILQLLRRHAGRVPDLDLMFDCQDLPVVNAGDRAPPPLFRYCGSEPTLDIAFPDWSFWGWPELNIKPWEALRREIEEGSAALQWTRRAPYAFWKGNPTVGTVRWELLKCNVSGRRDWNARIYSQDWRKPVRDGFRESDLAKQCTHRYKIYVEGRGWSVSEKYILACDSVALVVRPRFHDFFSRGLLPLQHYWPVRDRGQCRSIEFAVDWGNSHPDKLQASLPTTAAIPAVAAALHPKTQHPNPSRRSPSRAPRPPPAAYSISCSTPSLRPNISHPAKARESSQTLALALSSSSSCRSSPDTPPATDTTAAPSSSNSSCPSYFRFIHEDLRPWRAAGGVTRAMLARARVTASFRLVVLGGRAFVQRFRPAFQTRDLFTIWGILQLLRRYPGRVPDLDLMFDCVDWPVVRTHLYRGKHAAFMPPLFRYCGDDRTLDIVFPDWSFWGWPEINIKPWDTLQKDLKNGNNRVRWSDREPYAYWKGNAAVAVSRQELVKCNISSTQDWNARIYTQDWFKESKAGYKNSDLGSQCTHRYKIYIEGSAWSISQKYILACDSMTLLVTPKYYDFFSRSLMPIQHYWPVRDDNKCASIKYAVEWGNSHKQSAQRIGKEASNFVQEEVNMDHVYDYMLHLLTEYAKLLRFKPTKPHEAVEVCPESLVCQADGTEKKFLMESMVKSIHDPGPCDLPPPFSHRELRMLKQRKENTVRQVEMWERRASAA